MTAQYGFVIDQRKCIGCHACTVACKAENEVPLGSFRTWVKYTEKGVFPEVRRHFAVLRCNHCDAAPCVTICPVTALHKRKDAIVDLDRDACIGCRACMQACPYDAIYFNEDRGTTEKCHYCAHRTEVGLEPACVVVCPEQAIIAGDMSDPETPISRLLAEQETSRRKLEKGTKPRLYYIDVLPESLVPGVAAEPAGYLWSDRSPLDVAPPVVPGYEPTPDITTTLDVPHPPAWGWHVWLYLVTKNVAAGAALLAPFLTMLRVRDGFARDFVPEIVALVFLAITNLLLVHDLGRPERAWRLLLKPNTKSWLVKGAWVLMAFGALTTASLGFRLLGFDAAADVVRWLNVPAAVFAAGYSAFLFQQCRGRDLWLEPGLFTQLVARAALLGAGLVMLLPQEESRPHPALLLFAALVVVNAAIGVRDRLRVAGSDDAARARAGLPDHFAPGLMLSFAAFAVAGTLALAFLTTPHAWLALLAPLAAVIAAIVMHEIAWVRSGQEFPLS